VPREENQVAPFSLGTVDGETLYAWHVLPLPLYSKHEVELAAQPSGFVQNMQQTLNFKLLKDDPNARLVLFCKLSCTESHIPRVTNVLAVHGVSF
jgi:hypothetical protein